MKFFGNDTIFGRIVTRSGIIIGANLCFVLSLFLVITAGAGLAGLYTVMLRVLRGDGILNPFKEFWKGFRTNFKQGTIAEILFIALAVLLYLELFWCQQMEGMLAMVGFGIGAIALVVLLIACYFFPTLAAFHGSILQLMKNGFYFAWKNPIKAILVLVSTVFPFMVTYMDMNFLPLFAFVWVLCGFGCIAMFHSWMLLPLFKPYLPAVDAFGNILTEEELEELNANGGVPSGGRVQSEAEVLAEMRKLGM